MLQAELLVPFRLAVDERFEAEALNEALQFAFRGSAFGEIDKVCADPSLGEEPQCLPCLCAFLEAEYLDFHNERIPFVKDEAE